MLRRTPCIGICSTTYGDLVCRGCKRFAHEIVGWNGYERTQRDAVWARLLALRAGATAHCVTVVDQDRLAAMTPEPGFGEPFDTDPHLRAHEGLRRLAGEAPALAEALARLGLVLRDGIRAASLEALLREIDQELFRRSVAQYERNYRTPAL